MSVRNKLLTEIKSAIENNEILDNIDISGVDLSFLNFTGITADRLQGQKTDFKGTALMNASFRDCNFDEAVFENCNFQEADIADCFFYRTQFQHVSMKKAKLAISFCSEACFDGADLSESILVGTSFDDASFVNANLSRADAESVVFIGADLTGADLSYGNFEEADFTNAKLDRVRWKGANIKGAVFDEIIKGKIITLI